MRVLINGKLDNLEVFSLLELIRETLLSHSLAILNLSMWNTNSLHNNNKNIKKLSKRKLPLITHITKIKLLKAKEDKKKKKNKKKKIEKLLKTWWKDKIQDKIKKKLDLDHYLMIYKVINRLKLKLHMSNLKHNNNIVQPSTQISIIIYNLSQYISYLSIEVKFKQYNLTIIYSKWM